MVEKQLLVGDSSFRSLRKRNAYYVDKTAFIESILNDGNSVSLITRPRRFGKTLLQTTLECFFAINYRRPEDLSEVRILFSGLAVTRNEAFCRTHMGQWPVILISFKDFNGNSFEDSIQSLARILYSAAKDFAFLTENPALNEFDRNDFLKVLHVKGLPFHEQKTVLAEGLKILMQVLRSVYAKEVIVLVDEYDVPLNHARTAGYYNDLFPLLKEMLSGALKDNANLFKGVVTGCLRIAKESVFTDLNNFGSHSVSDTDLAAAVGFTRDEAAVILSDFNLTPWADPVRQHYDGYRFGHEEIYCPWDLLSFCRDFAKKKPVLFNNYWINTSSNELITEFIRYADETHLKLLRTLMSGSTISARVTEDLSFAEINAAHSPQHLLSLLYCTGYLTCVGTTDDGLMTLQIPNQEVRKCYERQIATYFSKDGSDYVQTGKELAARLIAGQSGAANTFLQNFLARYVSVRDTGSEAFYHGLLLGLLGASDRLSLESNQESGDGYFDLRFVDAHDNVAVILELKKTDHPADLSEVAHRALSQIHERRYFADYTGAGFRSVWLYGIAFSGKHCRMAAEKLSI